MKFFNFDFFTTIELIRKKNVEEFSIIDFCPFPYIYLMSVSFLLAEPISGNNICTVWLVIHHFNHIQVDFMLGSYMEDIGINSGQFEEACGKGSNKSFQHGLFEQVHSPHPGVALGNINCLPIRSGLLTTLRSSKG